MSSWILIYIFLIKSLSSQSESCGEQHTDLEREFSDAGQIHVLQAFKSPENEKHLADIKNHKKLKWYSIGVPLLVKTNSGKNESLFHFSPQGFSTHIQMLTLQHKKLFVEEIYQKYEIDVKLNQIENLILTSFTCKMVVHHNKDSSEINGSVKTFRTYPLRMDFSVPTSSNEIDWLKLSLIDGVKVQMDCEISSKYFSGFKFSLYTENLITVCGLKMPDKNSDESSKLVLTV